MIINQSLYVITQDKTLHMDINRWSILKCIIFFATKDGKVLYIQ